MEQTPRVNGGKLATLPPLTVCRIVGHVISVNGNNVTLEASDKVKFTVITEDSSQYQDFVEIVGEISPNDPSTLTELQMVGFGPSFDIEVHEAILKLMPQYTEIF